MIKYNAIHWNRESGRFVAIADPDIKVSKDGRNPRYVFVAIEGNTVKNEVNTKVVKLTQDGAENLFYHMSLGKRRFKDYREDQIRNWHPEFRIEELDELVEKITLFERIAA
jgi:hypothetical protein